MTDPLAEVREAVAAKHGLPARAAILLHGDTVEEVEQSAERLTTLVESHDPGEPPQPPSILEWARAEKAARQRSLIDALTGRQPQPRDDQGRFVESAGTGGFDGGARPLMPPEPLTADQVLAEALRTGSHDVGANL